MTFKNPAIRSVLVLAQIALGALPVFAQIKTMEGQQQMADFSLSGFAEKGKKSWDLTGKQADIAAENIKLKDIEGNFYGDKDNMKLTADHGDFNRLKGSMHLEKDVVVTTTSGARMTTNTLDWDRKQQLVTTPDAVNIVKDDVTIDGQGARANTGMDKVNLEKDISVQIGGGGITGQPRKEKTEITCDGPLEVDYQKNQAVFNKNVKVQTKDGLIESDAMDVYFLSNKESKPAALDPASAAELSGLKIDRIIARGNVRITRGQNVSNSEQAVYSARDRKITLTGRPKLVIYSSEELSASVRN